LLIVDESHRLQRRRNIVAYHAYDKTNRSLGLNREATQLDWIMQSSKNQILFYDKNQSVKPSDIQQDNFEKLNAIQYTLTTQMRVEAGEEYINFIEDIFNYKNPKITDFGNYEFKMVNNIEELFSNIKEKDKKHGLSRVVAGYAWPWHSRTGVQDYDIEIDGFKAIWNSTATDWVNSPNAINEVGCIHTVQGYDLNYVGVIVGPEFGYDPTKKKFFVDREKYFDRNGHAGITDPEELERYIINIYKTLLTRGIKGCYVYICNSELKNFITSLYRLNNN
jgi:DUF2075 family protein